jgi:protocatechuate 3,4-dioxygenase beta subunit
VAVRRTPTLVLFLLLAAAGIGFLAVDPLGVISSVSREGAKEEESAPIARNPELRGSKGPPRPEKEGYFEGDPVGVLDLKKGGAVLKGIVTGEGRPLEHARVQPVLAPPLDALAVRTGKDGAYEIRGLEAGPYELRASAEGFRPRTVAPPPVAEGQTATVPPIDLSRRPPLKDGIEAKVTDPFGRPIKGAKVLATTMPWDLHLAIGPELTGVRDVIHRTGVTDDGGTVVLSPLPPEKYSVVANAPGFATLAFEDVVLAAGRVQKLTFRLGPAAAIAGVVVDENGRPLKDAFVMGLHQPSFASSVATKSLADGTFTLDGLREGNYMVVAGQDDHGQVVANPIKSPSGGNRLQLGGAGVVEGTIVRPDGRPVTSARVRPFRSGPFEYVYSMSREVKDDHGKFRMPLPPGAWRFHVQAEDGMMSQDVTTTVEVGKTSQVRIVIPVTGIVRGVVVDPNGDHVEGAEVYVRMGGFPPGPSREQYARSDADGRFTVTGLALEPVGLHVRHPRYADASFDAKPQLSSDAKEVTIRLSAGCRVVGRVADVEGRGVPGEQVNLFQNFFEAVTTFCDGEGNYAFEAVAPGTYQATTGRFENGAGGLMKSGIQVPAGGTVTVNFETKAGQGGVSGVVRLGGNPVAGASITVTDRRGFDHVVTVTTDAAGKFEAVGLEYGDVRVRVDTQDGISATKSTRISQEEPNATVAVDLGSSTVRARVVDGAGAPVSGAWVGVEITTPGESVWSRTKAQKTSGQDGTFEATGLPGGTYQVRISSAEHAQFLTDTFPLAEGERKDLGDLRLAVGANLSGRVTDDTGAPVEDATVSLVDSTGRPVFLFSLSTTGSDGRYTVQGIVPGTYGVKFEAKGHAPYQASVDVGASGATADGVLARGGFARVEVLDAAGQPVEGARVTLHDASGHPVVRTLSLVNLFDGDLGVTKADGLAEIPDLASGPYRVTAARDGFTASGDAAQVYVPPGGAASTRIVLQRK